MASKRKLKLKLFRTPIGFHDAFVAAPSRKAALEAWGADSNLFAQGIAEEVEDPAMLEEASARPGEVIRRLRGTAEEQVAALAAEPRRGTRRPTPAPPLKGRGKKPPKPDRDALDAAEAALAKADKRQRQALRRIEEQAERIERERRDLLRKHEAERDALAQGLSRARAAYERAVRSWEKG